jgi:hypothetical protein
MFVTLDSVPSHALDGYIFAVYLAIALVDITELA